MSKSWSDSRVVVLKWSYYTDYGRVRVVLEGDIMRICKTITRFCEIHAIELVALDAVHFERIR